MANTRLLVTGATGRIGGAVAAQLLERGVTTRALVHREDGRSARLQALGAEVVVAYEPIWAIGTGRNATGALCSEMALTIREALGRFWPARHRDETAVLYGGSVTPDNIADLETNGRVDGYLVGGASLDSAKFLTLLRAMQGV